MAYIDQIEVDGVMNEFQDTGARQQIQALSEAGFITRSVNDLVNYYTKTETYTKTEVKNLVAAIKQFTYEVVATLPTASESTMYTIYLVPATTTETQNVKDEYITIQEGNVYKWEQIGSTAIDFSGYSTTEEMNAAIANALTNYYTKTSIDDIVATLVSETDFESYKQDARDTFARKDGFYETFGAGSAKALVGNTTVDKVFTSMVMDCADGLSKINEVKGKSLVWNQLVKKASLTPLSGVTYSDYSGNKFTVNGTPDKSNQCFFHFVRLVNGHKYLYHFAVNNFPITTSTNYCFQIYENVVPETYFGITDANVSASGDAVKKGVFLAEADSTATSCSVRIILDTAITYTNTVFSYPTLIDLTLMFGAGNEPNTVEEFEAMFPLPYYEYNEGEIISNATEKLDVTGFNQWDEEWEVGNVNPSTGNNYQSEVNIRSKNYIPVIPSTNYFIRMTGQHYLSVCFYDANKTFVSSNSAFTSNNGITTPSNAAFMRFSPQRTYGNTYNHDICINISDSNKNGTYEPYKHKEMAFNLTSITGKVNGEGESVVVFPDGMRSAGSVFDSLVIDEDGFARKAIVRIGSVDMGTLTWNLSQNASELNIFTSAAIQTKVGVNLVKSNIISPNYSVAKSTGINYINDKSVLIAAYYSNIQVGDSSYSDAATFKTAMSGVELIYELAEYKEYVLDTPIPMTFQAYHNGVIRQVPQAPDSAPMSMNFTSSIDAVGSLTNLPKNYISSESMDAFLAQLGTAMNGTWTKTYNTSTQKYEFSFTPNA